MSDHRRVSRRLLAYLLAVPVIVLVYVGTFGTRVWAALRPPIATVLGVTVIGSVYADEALKRAPTTPMRAAAVLALAVALVGTGMAPPPASAAAADPASAVIAAARGYLGVPYKLGAESPDRMDCSGFLFRTFSDVGQLPRIGGMRLRAVGYMRWFISRGLFTKDVDEARPGDLVVWNKGDHIGIYLGNNKAISALVNPYGITIHSLGGIHQRVDYFLQIDWRNGDGPPDPKPGDGDPGPGDNEPDPGADPGAGPGNGDSTGSDQDSGGAEPDDGEPTDKPEPDDSNPNPDNPPDHPSAQPDNGKRGLSTGVLNMRMAADPNARIVGWLGRGKTFKIIGSGNSPAGYKWFEVETVSGKQGWIYSYWVREL